MEIIKQAIEKIKEEIEQDNNPYMQVVGSYVLRNLEVNKPSAEKIVAGTKTISGSLKAMEDEARKVAKNGVGILTDEQGFEIVSEYFEFEGVQVCNDDTVSDNNKVIDISYKKKDSSEKNIFDVNIDDLF